MSSKFMIAVLGLVIPAAAVADNMSEHKAATFKVRVENVSTGETLKLSNGSTAPNPNSPVGWTVQMAGVAPFFKLGKKDLGYGLEALAEDGNPEPLIEHCKHHKGVVSAGLVNIPVGDDKPGPALPGKAFEFSFAAEPGQRFSMVTMFGQSNDWFYGLAERGVALFDGDTPLSGDITSKFSLYNAGTEVDQEPGLGADQGPRQKGPNTGAAENGTVRVLKSKYSVPKTADVIKVTITPVTSMAGN